MAIKTHVSVSGTVACPSCHSEFDLNNPGGQEKKPALKKKPLTSVDIFFRFMIWSLGLATAIALIAEMVK